MSEAEVVEKEVTAEAAEIAEEERIYAQRAAARQGPYHCFACQKLVCLVKESTRCKNCNRPVWEAMAVAGGDHRNKWRTSKAIYAGIVGTPVKGIKKTPEPVVESEPQPKQPEIERPAAPINLKPVKLTKTLLGWLKSLHGLGITDGAARDTWTKLEALGLVYTVDSNHSVSQSSWKLTAKGIELATK